MAQQQSFQHHARYVPGFHFGVLGVLALNLVWSGYRLWRGPAFESVLGALMALALVALAVYARNFALTVQNRVIRLEMRLRLLDRLPVDLRPRIDTLHTGQLVALRFASDAELPELTRQVLVEGITDKRVIKSRIRDWQADHLRA